MDQAVQVVGAIPILVAHVAAQFGASLWGFVQVQRGGQPAEVHP